MKPSQLPEVRGLVACDTETSGLHVDDGARVAVVSVAWIEPTHPPRRDGASISCVLCISGEHPSTTVRAYAFPFDQGRRDKIESDQLAMVVEQDVNLPQAEWDALLAWLARQRLVMHNGRFDLHMLLEGTREWSGIDLIDRLVWDTELAERELAPLELAGLKESAERRALLGGGERDLERAVDAALKKARTKRRDLLDWSLVEAYAASDAELTILLQADQERRFEEGLGSWAFYRREMDTLRVLYAKERRGIGFDVSAALAADAKLADVQRRMAERLPFSPPTLDRAKIFFFKERGLEPDKRTPGGAPSLDDEALGLLVERGEDDARKFAAYRKIENARSKWYGAYPKMVGSDGRLRPVFSQGKVISGRSSAERLNLQAIPHDHRLRLVLKHVPPVRSLFRADEGKQLWELDLSQAELRAAAAFAKCQRMLELIEDDADLHGQTAKDLFDVHEDDEAFFGRRQMAKRANFAMIFGVGPERFQADLRKNAGVTVTLDEAAGIVYAWRRLYPEFQRAIKRWERVVRERGWIQLVTGRPRYFRAWEEEHKAFNQLVQGSLAEVVKDWELMIEREFPGVLILSIHDSLVLETDDDSVPERAAKMGAELGTAMIGVRMEVDTKIWKAA